MLNEAGLALGRAGYTVAGVRELLGPVAGGALARDEVVPALRAARGGTPLEELLKLFWLQVPADAKPVPYADELVAAGLAERSGGELRALLRVEPVEGAAADGGHRGYAVSDLKVRPGSGAALRPDHVVSVGGASASLARLAVHGPVGSALDIGTGCGVQALHLAGRADRITGTDVNPRALALARLSLELSGVEGVELVRGSLYEPVRDRRFDLIVSNPPFVIAPPASGPSAGGPSGGLVYRESGMGGDEVCRRLVAGAPERLNDGGWCRLLASWLHVEGQDWRDRVGGWVGATGCDAWVVQRDVRDPAEYAELWLRDSAEAGTPGYERRYRDWLELFGRERVIGIGFGWIILWKRGSADPAVRVEDLPHRVDEPVGAYLEQVLGGLAAGRDFALGSGRPLAAAPGLVQEQLGPPGADDPERIVLRQTAGLRRAAGVGTVEAALAGVCDGTLPLEPLLDAIAQLLDLPPDQVRAHAAAVLPELIADGFFVS